MATESDHEITQALSRTLAELDLAELGEPGPLQRPRRARAGGPVLLFLDTETTSLDADTGEIWEIGAILRQPGHPDRIYHRFVDVTLEHADPKSLDIGRFHERHPQGDRYKVSSPYRASSSYAAHEFATLARGAHLVGNVVSFDEERLRRLLRRHGHQPTWNYHLVDCEALIAGSYRVQPPWKSSDLSWLIGVEPPTPDQRHTALGDALWSRRIYDAIMNP